MANNAQKNDVDCDLKEPLAIIGMNCRFPGVEFDVEDVDAFYAMLMKGTTPIKEVPSCRWNIDKYYDSNRKTADKIISRKGGFLNSADLFDAEFFKISPVEAKQMDPQHRLFLEVSIRALNHANLALAILDGTKTGVYCGISTDDYGQLNTKDHIQVNEYTQIGMAKSAAPGRLSRFLNVTGPSVAVDTACASSLTALYLAAIGLRTHQCDTAIVGGVHLNLCPDNFIGLSKANMLSAAGECRSFDAEADGFVRSEGCGVVVVKRLSDAIKDKNTIHAVLNSIVMNHNGDGSSLVAPNLNAQIEMHQALLALANVTPSDIGYIETHGTGTVVGDGVEFDAIQLIHEGHHSKEHPLVIGALKSLLGHTISSSGIASLIKVICSLKNDTIPPNLHYLKPQQSINPDRIPAILPVKATRFIKRNHQTRYAQISNFGFSGTNVGLIVSEYSSADLPRSYVESNDLTCFVMSANSSLSLKHMMIHFVSYLKGSSIHLSDVCYTLINGRDHFKYRCAILVHDKDELIKKIEAEDYEVVPVVVKKGIKEVPNKAQDIFAAFRSGINIRLHATAAQYNAVDLPLYYFDRRSYWHESRQPISAPHWLDALHQESQEQQIETISIQLRSQIAGILKKDSVHEHADFETLGLTQPLMAELGRLFLYRYNLPFSPTLTIDKLARYLQQQMEAGVVHQQPSINVLHTEPIAIIGMSCRFPKAANIDEFLSLLDQGDSGMTDIPLDRWDNEAYYDADVNAPGRLCIKQLGLMDHIKNFDAEFFNISPREAKLMSPQLRVFMETSYHAIEEANLSLETIKGSNTGVFVGVGTNEYPAVLLGAGLSLEELNIYFATGNVLNALPGRVAYAFDWHGPIQAIDTACSSSMTAIHNACLSLQSGDCDMAIAGGVNTLLTPNSNITLSKAKMLSPESRCKTFSDDADGYARSEGCGVLVLKRLSTAMKDNDTILAVIKGSSVNSDGKSGGFTVPNGAAQEQVIRSALAKSQLSPGDIDYIEAHGTGTPIADPIEVNTLTKIFSEDHSQANPLYIGSVKTNIGHCESASGVAGMIKVILSLQTKTLFKHLNFKQLNPWIELKNTAIPLEPTPWSKTNGLRCAGVSSFGFSGANAHVVVQEAPSRPKKSRRLPQECLLVLSAKNTIALDLLLVSYQKYLANTSNEFADICYTAATCRSHFKVRVAIKANTAKHAAEILKKKQYTIHPIKKEQDRVLKEYTLQQAQVAYQDGFAVPWSDFYNSLDRSFEKVRLPLYEFARVEHWFEDKKRLKEAVLPKDWSFKLHWEPQRFDRNNGTSRGGDWLLMGAQSLAPVFTSQGLPLLLEGGDYSLEQLRGVIFAAALDPVSSEDMDANIDFQKKLIKQLLALVKALNQKAIKLQLIVLTTHGVAELAVGQCNLSNSSIVGFCKTLALELPQFNTILIDADHTDSPSFADQVIDEINHNHGSCYESMIAYREGHRFVVRLKKAVLPDIPSSLHGKSRYLITGGCGGLGLVTAQALLSAGAGELILTSRTIDTPLIQSAIKKIQSNYPDRNIRLVGLDISQKDSLRRLMLEITADGLLKGIIHAAGAACSAAVIEHQEEDVDHLFSAKVQGGWYLHEFSQHCSLDFFVVYSSIASVFGSNKESVYSATNSFLDGLIAERRRLGLVGTAIQWGSWGDAGMAIKRSRDQGLKEALITNEQGNAFIKRLINGPLDQVTIISPEYLRFMLEFVSKPLAGFYQCLKDDLFVAEQPNEKSVSPWLSDYLAMGDEKKAQECRNMLLRICKAILETEETYDLDENEGFYEMGFDSLMITEMANKLKENLAPVLKISVTIGFDYPSIHKLSQYIASELEHTFVKKRSVMPSEKHHEDSIAIIGMSCSLPEAPNIAAFEKLLLEGQNGIREIPIERWDNSQYYDSNRDAPGKSYVNKLGLIENIKTFDANFFGISPREAKLMDPQQRIFLECCYKAIENANYPMGSLRGSVTGVYAGVGPNEFYGQLEQSGFSNEELTTYSITGNVLNLIPGRVAYFFDFKGPAISVDTACSSSLVAIHYACQGLKNKDTDYALAGGVNILLRPESNITLSQAKALSPDGQCKTFDKEADGYARSEGCGVIVLKRLSDALRDNDTILAVIKASAVNNDGKSAGLTVPNGKSQEDVMRKALSQTELSSADIGYIEAHGTGTALGDPIEARAIHSVYGQDRGTTNPLYLGTVKTNIGHLESASGVAGMIKTVLSLKHKKIYKHLNFKTLNPEITLNDTRIALEITDWIGDLKPKCAGVNAFGFSGTNAHIIVQEFLQPTSHRSAKRDQTHALVLSAKSKVALDKLVTRYQGYLKTTVHDFGDICFTGATGREHYIYRMVVLAKTVSEASECLEMGRFALSHGHNNRIELPTDQTIQRLLTKYLQGGAIDWSSYYATLDEDFSRIILPNYTFDRSEFWPDKKVVREPLVSYEPLLNQVYALRWNSLNFDQTSPSEVPFLWGISNGEVSFKSAPKATWLSDQGKRLPLSRPHFLNSLRSLEREACIRALSHALCDIAADVLGMPNRDQVTPTDDLLSLGMDSLMSVDIRNRIQDKLQCPVLSLSIEPFISEPSLLKIAKNITDELQAIFQWDLDDPCANVSLGEEIALCDFQYPFWAINKLGYGYNTAMQLQLHGPLNQEHLSQAFDEVIQQHSAFWLHFNDTIPTQTLKHSGPFQLIYKDISLSNEKSGLNREFFNNMMRRIPLTEQPLIRVYLYKVTTDRHELHIVYPHIIADDASGEILFSQFKASYEALNAGKRPITRPEKKTFLDYVRSNNHHYQKNLQDKIDFWRIYNKGVALLHFGQAHYWSETAAEASKYLFHYPLDRQEMKQFIHWHQSNNLNVSSGLIAACQIAFHQMTQQRKIPIILIHTGREGTQYMSVVGLFSEYKRINLHLKKGNTFKDSVKSIEEQFLKTAPYQKCSYFIKNKGLKGTRLFIGQPILLAFHKLFLVKRFKKSKINATIIHYYLDYLSWIESIKITNVCKHKLNKIFKRGIPPPKAEGVKVLINITPGFFIKESQKMSFADINYTYPGYFACLNRPIGNQVLWVYFSKNQYGDYQLSINGPLTTACKDQLAFHIRQSISTQIETEERSVGGLTQEALFSDIVD